MKNRVKLQIFLKNEDAVSEEFTVLPALSIVMIGFALFVVLLAQTYIAYTDHISRLQNYHTANGLLQKLTNPDCYFVRDGGLIDVSILQKDNTSLQKLGEQYRQSGVLFLFQLAWNDQSQNFPDIEPAANVSRIAVSKPVGVYLNEAQTLPGAFTIIVWRAS
ncbi:MAG: hypothetical protein WC525_00520 [Candidatus Thermoplasmatota archaeon]